MQYTEDSVQAAHYLRKAIPMMVKHNIHPNPRNFALWYAYVSQQNNDLVKEIDAAIAEHNTCPDYISSDLFRRYIIDEEVDFGHEILKQLTSIISELAGQSDNMVKGSDNYNSFLEQGIKSLNKDPTQSELKGVIKTLMEQTGKSSDIARKFKNEIDKANNKINQLRQELKNIQQEAALDPLTQIYNRRAFEKEIRKLTEKSSQSTEPLVILMADLDHFKRCNDNYGHVVGDKIIQSFAQILNRICSGIGFSARYGGEEFVVLLPNHNLDQAKQVAEKIRATTEGMKIKQRGSEKPIDQVTTSVGLAQYCQDENCSDFISRADAALYHAKETGRNRIEVG